MEDLSDVPSRGDQAVDRAEYRRLSWEGAKARLEKDLAGWEGSPIASAQLLAADIRAALERVEELEREKTREIECANRRMIAEGEQKISHLERAEAAEAKLAEATIKLRLLPSEAAWREGARMLQEADRARQAAESEVERLRAAHREMRDILGVGDPEREDGECARCGEPYNVRPGCEYSPGCDSCAQVILGNARAALAPAQPDEMPGYEHECPTCGDFFDKHEVHFCTKPPKPEEGKR